MFQLSQINDELDVLLPVLFRGFAHWPALNATWSDSQPVADFLVFPHHFAVMVPLSTNGKTAFFVSGNLRV